MMSAVTSLHHPDEDIHGTFSISHGTLNREGCHHYLLKMTPGFFSRRTCTCPWSHWQGHSSTVNKATSSRFRCILKSSWAIPDWVTVGPVGFPLTIRRYWNRWITAYNSLRPVSLGPWLVNGTRPRALGLTNRPCLHEKVEWCGRWFLTWTAMH